MKMGKKNNKKTQRSTYQNRTLKNHKVCRHKGKIRNVQTNRHGPNINRMQTPMKSKHCLVSTLLVHAYQSEQRFRKIRGIMSGEIERQQRNRHGVVSRKTTGGGGGGGGKGGGAGGGGGVEGLKLLLLAQNLALNSDAIPNICSGLHMSTLFSCF